VLNLYSAINLADYYLVRRGRYDVKALYDSRSEYGTYRWRTIAIYCVDIAVQAPFMEPVVLHWPHRTWIGSRYRVAAGIACSGVPLYCCRARLAQRRSALKAFIAPSAN
jgi:nucleobase:cation symporter-1, NCS1 family